MTEKLTTEVIGFRQWRVGDDLELRSGHIADHWLPGDNKATCHGQQNPFDVYGRDRVNYCKDCPGNDCHCGFYALHRPSFWYGKDRDRQRHPFSVVLTFGPEPDFVAGLIAGWGKVQVHHDGFRAQYAKVVALAVPTDGKKRIALARACAAEYGVPTVPQNELERVASEFGSLVPVELRPPAQPRFEDEINRLYSRFMQSSSSSLWQFPSEPKKSKKAKPEKPKTKTPRQKLAEDLAAIKPHAQYDPRHFQAKRNGGLR